MIKPLRVPPAAWLSAAAFAYLWIGAALGVFHLDDGAPLYGAWRVASGDVPYRDFVSLYAPGDYYALALVFRAFGASMLVERVWTCACLAAALSAVWTIAWMFLSARRALAAWLMALAWCGGFGHVPGPQAPALALTLWAFAAALWAARSDRARSYAAAGALTALGTLFKQDLGVYALVAVVALFTVFARSKMKAAAAFAAGFAAPAVPAAAYFLATVPPADLAASLLAHTAASYRAVARLPFPNPLAPLGAFAAGSLGAPRLLLELSRESAFFAVPAAAGITAARTVWAAFRGKAVRGFPEKCGLAGLASLFFVQALLRCDDWHLLPSFLAAAPLFADLFPARPPRARLAAAAAAALLVLEPLALKAGAAVMTMRSAPLTAPRARGVRVPLAFEDQRRRVAEYEEAVAYVRSIVPPDARIFVGSVRHDRICQSDPLFYFLAERHAGTRFGELYRGVATTEAAQRRIVDDLERSRVDVAVLRKALDACDEPNDSSKSSGVTVLDDYLRATFEPDRAFGGNFVVRRKRG